MTARSLETLIRLSTAHARARLSNKIEASDCDSAIALLQFALYNDATAKADLDAAGENDGKRANATGSAATAAAESAAKKRRVDNGEDGPDRNADDNEQEMDVDDGQDVQEDDPERFEKFRQTVSAALQEFQKNPESENGIKVGKKEGRKDKGRRG